MLKNYYFQSGNFIIDNYQMANDKIYSLGSNIKFIICDIEGTTTSISFVKVIFAILVNSRFQ